MPNLSALLDAHPEWRDVIALEDGRIASLPMILIYLLFEKQIVQGVAMDGIKG